MQHYLLPIIRTRRSAIISTGCNRTIEPIMQCDQYRQFYRRFSTQHMSPDHPEKKAERQTKRSQYTEEDPVLKQAYADGYIHDKKGKYDFKSIGIFFIVSGIIGGGGYLAMKSFVHHYKTKKQQRHVGEPPYHLGGAVTDLADEVRTRKQVIGDLDLHRHKHHKQSPTNSMPDEARLNGDTSNDSVIKKSSLSPTSET